MKEWFREFQVACERSEQVMQKTSKPVRQLQYHSGAASAGYSGGIEQEEGIDSIRFCDVTSPVYASNAAGTTGKIGAMNNGRAAGGKDKAEKSDTAAVAVMPVLPASMLEDVPLSVLLAQAVSSLLIACLSCHVKYRAHGGRLHCRHIFL